MSVATRFLGQVSIWASGRRATGDECPLLPQLVLSGEKPAAAGLNELAVVDAPRQVAEAGFKFRDRHAGGPIIDVEEGARFPDTRIDQPSLGRETRIQRGVGQGRQESWLASGSVGIRTYEEIEPNSWQTLVPPKPEALFKMKWGWRASDCRGRYSAAAAKSGVSRPACW